MAEYQCNNPFHKVQDRIWWAIGVLSTLGIAYVVLKQIFPNIHWPF